MIYLAFTIYFVAKLAAIIWLISNDHPWWALAIFLLMEVEFKDDKDD